VRAYAEHPQVFKFIAQEHKRKKKMMLAIEQRIVRRACADRPTEALPASANRRWNAAAG
jgi:hypothetical protein